MSKVTRGINKGMIKTNLDELVLAHVDYMEIHEQWTPISAVRTEGHDGPPFGRQDVIYAEVGDSFLLRVDDGRQEREILVTV